MAPSGFPFTDVILTVFKSSSKEADCSDKVHMFVTSPIISYLMSFFTRDIWVWLPVIWVFGPRT